MFGRKLEHNPDQHTFGYYILPTYPSDLTAIQFDRSGQASSFILPG